MHKLPNWSAYLDGDSDAGDQQWTFSFLWGSKPSWFGFFSYLVITGSKAVPAQKSSLHDILVKACLFLFVLQLQVLLVKL